MKKFFAFVAAVLFAGSMMAGNALMVTYDFTTNAWGLPEGSAQGASAAAQFDNGTDTITLEAADKYYFNTDGYLIMGKQGSTLTLPAFEWNTSKIVITGRDAASGAVKQNIYVGDNAVSAETTGAKGVNEYVIAENYQAAGNVYVLKVTSAHNTQITKIEIYAPCDTCSEPVEPVDSTEIYAIDFTKGQGEWTINDVAKDTLNFVWQQDNSYGMKASAYYDNAAHATESWLISPVIDLSEAEDVIMTINHAMNKGNNSTLAIKATVDGESWEDVEISAWPAGTSWNFEEAVADLSDYAGIDSVKIAFVYVSTLNNCPTWEIKSIKINMGEAPEPPVTADVTFLPADFEGQGQAATLETPGGEVSATKNGVTVSANDAYGHSLALRVYASNEELQVVSTFSIVSATEQIGKIKFQFYQTYTGDLPEEVIVNAKEWSVDSMTKHSRIEKIEIFFGEEQGIENVVLTEKAQKVMVDGVLYIVRDGKMFDVRGAQVR